MGFFFHNRYEIGVKFIDAPIFTASVRVNPTYEMRASSDGFVLVKESDFAPTYVVLIPGKNSVKNNIIIPGLRKNLPIQLEQQFRDNLTIALEDVTPGIPPPFQSAYTDMISCDADENRDQQQATCFGQIAGNPLLQQYVQNFITSLLPAPEFLPFAIAEAAKFVQGPRPENFTCRRTDTGDFCAFRSIVRRVNVLPNELELVLVQDLDSGGAQADNERALYSILPLLAINAGVPLPSELSSLCREPIRPTRGTIARYQRSNVPLPEPQSCAECYGADPVCEQF